MAGELTYAFAENLLEVESLPFIVTFATGNVQLETITMRFFCATVSFRKLMSIFRKTLHFICNKSMFVTTSRGAVSVLFYLRVFVN